MLLSSVDLERENPLFSIFFFLLLHFSASAGAAATPLWVIFEPESLQPFFGDPEHQSVAAKVRHRRAKKTTTLLLATNSS